SAESAKPARFSLQARELIKQLDLDERSFAGRGLVRASDVRVAAALVPTSAPPLQPGPIAAGRVATPSERLTRAKGVRRKSLRTGAETALRSSVTVACPTRGFRAAMARHAAVGGNATAVILAETARLLRKYPAFNAYHDDGTVTYYDAVNIGFAIDAG